MHNVNGEYKCGVCGISHSRLYRCAGEFFTAEKVRCKVQIPPKGKDWYVPLICDSDGTIWGKTSVPEEHYRAWLKLEDAIVRANWL